jgi:hypothetical protein
MTKRTFTFPWTEAERHLRELASAWSLAPDGRGGFAGEAVRFEPPRVLPPVAEHDTPDSWLRRLPANLGLELVVLAQAGAIAVGAWRDDVLIDHVAKKRYVVRGQGRAQPTHLRTRGKSRYGSRLRLQNHRLLLDELTDRLRTIVAREGEPDRVHHSAPPRLWDEILAHDPPPPFTRDDPRLSRIPLHVHVPDHEELLRVHRTLARGRIEVE